MSPIAPTIAPQQLAAKFDGQAILFEQLYDTCDRADIVITSTGAPHAIFRREHGELFLSRRKNRPMFFIDIAVPRDVDPEMNKLDGIFVYDIDDLQQAVSSHVADRRKEAERAEAIITGEVERFQARLQTLDVVPTIVSLQDHLETIRQAEIDRVRGRLGTLSPEQELAVEALTRGIVNKIMHTPISTLKTAAREPEATTVIDLVRRLFNLQERERREKSVAEVGGGRLAERKISGSAAHRFPRIATGALAGEPHHGAAASSAGTKSKSKSSRPPATRLPTSLSPRSAPRACSPRKSRKLWPRTASISRSTA